MTYDHLMTNKEAIEELKKVDTLDMPIRLCEAYYMSLKALEQEQNIKTLGEDMRICREAITDEKMLIGFNMAVAICNKYLGKSEGKK